MSTRRRDVLPPGTLPRGLCREEAAAYVGVSVGKFNDMVRDRRMPAPKVAGPLCRVWDRFAINTHLFRNADEKLALQSNVVDPPAFTTGYVYFITADRLPFIKVGYAGSPLIRLRELQTGSPYLLKIVVAFRGNPEDEDRLHIILARHRGIGEWFRKAPTLKLANALQMRCGDNDAIAPHIRGREPL